MCVEMNFLHVALQRILCGKRGSVLFKMRSLCILWRTAVFASPLAVRWRIDAPELRSNKSCPWPELMGSSCTRRLCCESLKQNKQNTRNFLGKVGRGLLRGRHVRVPSGVWNEKNGVFVCELCRHGNSK